MIIWGTKSKVIPGPTVEGVQCPECDSTTFNTFGILKYMHLYWIPFVTKGRTPGIECTHCKKTMIGKEMPGELASQIKSTVFTKKTVLSKCIGIFLVVAILIAGFMHGAQHSKDEIAYLAQPAVHDMYTVNFAKIFENVDTKYKYGVMRIQSINGENIVFQVGKLGYKSTRGLRKDIRWGKADKDDYYDPSTETFTLSELQKLKTDGAITSIDRD